MNRLEEISQYYRAYLTWSIPYTAKQTNTKMKDMAIETYNPNTEYLQVEAGRSKV